MKKNSGKIEDNVPENIRVKEKPANDISGDIYDQESKVELDEETFPLVKNLHPMQLVDYDLDVPGADLDDANEKIGEEDEENNYYSLGGDGHNDLDEENG